MNAPEFIPTILQVQGTHIQPSVGQFSLDIPLNWISCRDRIAALFKDTHPGIFFSHEYDQGERTALFIWKTEEILEQEKSKFQKTNRNYALWCEPTKFWLSCGVRRSLFTLLLRQSTRYDPTKDNYEEALFVNDYVTRDYAAQTKNAIHRFLFGFTEYNNPGGHSLVAPGWTSLFRCADEKQVRQLLRQPNPEQEKCIIGAGKLWG